MFLKSSQNLWKISAKNVFLGKLQGEGRVFQGVLSGIVILKENLSGCRNGSETTKISHENYLIEVLRIDIMRVIDEEYKSNINPYN